VLTTKRIESASDAKAKRQFESRNEFRALPFLCQGDLWIRLGDTSGALPEAYDIRALQ